MVYGEGGGGGGGVPRLLATTEGQLHWQLRIKVKYVIYTRSDIFYINPIPPLFLAFSDLDNLQFVLTAL